MLTADQEQLWTTYLEQEEDGARSDLDRTLAAFVDAIGSSPRESWRDWAIDLCRRVVDDNEPIPVRFALFHQVLMPVILDGYRARVPGCARWLAGFPTFLCNCPDIQDELGDGKATQTALLRTALEHDPDDQASRCRLIKLTADWFRFTLNELPAGVLADLSMGANAAQCAELRTQLDEFCALCEGAGLTDEYAELIENCRYHYTGYPDYLEKRAEYPSYADYLERNASR